ncbi:MAG: hypothetical protein R2848_14370 [Thermomicrobiales bacterium]
MARGSKRSQGVRIRGAAFVVRRDVFRVLAAALIVLSTLFFANPTLAGLGNISSATLQLNQDGGDSGTEPGGR